MLFRSNFDIQLKINNPKSPTSSESKLSKNDSYASKSADLMANSNARAKALSFLGLDQTGTPIGFTITDSTGALGNLYFSDRDAVLSESGLSLASIAKTSDGAANLLLNQVVSQFGADTSYDVSLSYGKAGKWVPVVSNVISMETERLMSGNYLLTAIIQVKSEVDTAIVIPASAGGRDLEVRPSRVITRILLNSSKTRILAQAVQVLEKTPKL